MAATNAQTLFEESVCFACLPSTQVELLSLAILNRLMPAVATNTLMSEAKCYACYGPVSDAQLLKLALLRRWLISLSPGADTAPQSLISYAKCFACVGASMYDLMLLALIDQIAQAS